MDEDKLSLPLTEQIAGQNDDSVEQEPVSRRTKKRVLEIMRSIGSEKKPEQRSNIIVILTPANGNMFCYRVHRAIEAAAEKRGYKCVLRKCRPGRGVNPARECAGLDAGGIILMLPASASQMEELKNIAPVLQCCEYDPEGDGAWISIDNYAAEYTATKHLIDMGRKNIAFINYRPDLYYFARERQLGYAAALKDAGIEPDPDKMAELDSFDYEDALKAAKELFSLFPAPDAVVAAADIYGIAAIKAAQECGYDVPGDVAVIGFDNNAICCLPEPALSSVEQPAQQLGSMACEGLINMLENPDYLPPQVLLDTRLVMRGSTGEEKTE